MVCFSEDQLVFVDVTLMTVPVEVQEEQKCEPATLFGFVRYDFGEGFR